MITVKLVKARSYSGTVKATKAQPYVSVNTEEEAKALVDTGYFEICASSASDDINNDDGDDASNDDSGESLPNYEVLSKMTKSELAAYADENGINIEGCKTKADILEAISVANGGSYTMIDLQEEV